MFCIYNSELLCISVSSASSARECVRIGKEADIPLPIDSIYYINKKTWYLSVLIMVLSCTQFGFGTHSIRRTVGGISYQRYSSQPQERQLKSSSSCV